MKNQTQKIVTGRGASATGFSGSSGSGSLLQFQGGLAGGSSSSLNIGQMRGGPKEKGSSGKGGGSTSIGFVASYCLVLGLVGFVLMTDDTSATTDAIGGFSFFKVEDGDSFAVKPGARAHSKQSDFDWSRKKTSSTDRLKAQGLKLKDWVFGSGTPGHAINRDASAKFLAPGQLDELVSLLPVDTAGGAFANRPVLGSSSHKRPASGSGTSPSADQFGTTLSATTKFERYSLSNLQSPNTKAERNAVAVEDTPTAPQTGGYRILKGTLAGVSDGSGYDGALNLRVSYGRKAVEETVSLIGVTNGRAEASQFAIDWSGALASYFYRLEPGATSAAEGRGQQMASIALSPNSETCEELCLPKTNLEPLDTAKLAKHLAALVQNKNILVYIIQDHLIKSKPKVRAVLVQNLTDRKWKVIKLGGIVG